MSSLPPEERAVAVGAVEPLEEIGRGGEGMVFCDARRRAFKVGYDRARKRGRTLRDEAAWLETAQHVPWVKDHVAKFYRYDATHDVIVRECVESRTAPLGGGKRSADEAQMWNFMQEIGRRMNEYGWSAPEKKQDSIVATRDRGFVVVDAGFAIRKGPRYARWVSDLLAGRDSLRASETWEGVAWELQAEIDQGRLNRSVGERLLQRVERMKELRDNPRIMAKPKKTSKKTPRKHTAASRKNMTLAQLRTAHPQYKFGKGTGQFKHLVYVQFSSSADDREWAHTPGDLQKSIAGGKWGPGAQALAKKPSKKSTWGFDVQTGVKLSKKDRRPSHQAVIEDWLRSQKRPVPRDKRSKRWRDAVKSYESQGAAFARTEVRSNPMNPASAAVKRAILGMRASHYSRFKTLSHMFESGDLNGAASQLLHTRAVEEVFEGGGGYNLQHANAVAFLKRNKANVARWLSEASANEHTARRAVASVRNNPADLTDKEKEMLARVKRKQGQYFQGISHNLLDERALESLQKKGYVVFYNEGVTQSISGPRVKLAMRNNPITTKTSKRRLNASDSCSVKTASKLLRDRKKAKKNRKKMPYRYGNCATPSAEYVLHYHGKGKKSRSAKSSRKAPKNTHPRTRSKPRTAPTRRRRDTGSMVDWML